MFETILLGLVPGSLLLFVSKKIGQGNPPERAARFVMYLLMMSLLASFITLLFLRTEQFSSFLVISVVPVITAIVPIIYIHWRTTPSLHTRQITRLLLIWAGVVVVIMVAYSRLRNDAFLPLLIGGGGIVIALVWLLGSIDGRWRWLGLGVLVGAVLVQQFVYNGVLNNWPQWIQSLLTLASSLVWPVVAVALTGFFTARYIVPSSTSRWKVLAGLGAVALIIAFLAYQLNEATTLDSATDGLGMIMIASFLAIPGVAVALLLAWMGNKRTVLVYAGLVAVAVLSIGVVLHDNLNHRPPEIVEGRAAYIDQAIQNFYQVNGRYPEELYDLVPRFLLVIPNPLIFREQTWCYESDGSTYRFGYIERPAFGMPAEYITIHLQGSAGEFSSAPWECDAQLADYRTRYGITFQP